MISAEEYKKQFIDSWIESPIQNVNEIWFKREDKNPTGSIKSRGLVWQVYELLKSQTNKVVVSSSGNAAIAAAYYADRAGIKLFAFVPTTIDQSKLELLKKYNANVTVTNNAADKANEYAQKNQIKLMRQSLDPAARFGFQLLAQTLNAQLSECSISFKDTSIFFPTSSGTALSGFAKGCELNGYDLPQLHIVQTSAVNTIARVFDQEYHRVARSVVTGIVARKIDNTYYEDVVKAVKGSLGSGWVVSDLAITKAHQELTTLGITTSLEGAMAYAGLKKAREKNFPLRENLLVVLT